MVIHIKLTGQVLPWYEAGQGHVCSTVHSCLF